MAKRRGGMGGKDEVRDEFTIDDSVAEVETILDFDVGNFVSIELDFASGGETVADGGIVPAIVADDVEVLAGAVVDIGDVVFPILPIFNYDSVNADCSAFHLWGDL